jgi:hypothetical protein
VTTLAFLKADARAYGGHRLDACATEHDDMKLNWIFVLVCAAGWSAWARGADLTLADHGKTAYRIEVDKDAPGSVRTAAAELSAYVKKATGAELKIAEAGDQTPGPFISLGDTAAARAAGLKADGLTPDGYRLVTKGENLFIFGPDTPMGQRNATGGDSTGTLNGVYGFLEEVVGVRWLMPGADGEDVPHVSTLKVGEIDRTEGPAFASRTLPYVQNERKDVKRWLRRQRLGKTISVSHGHNWIKTIPAALYQQHPEWFPEIGGKRPPPTGRYKLETTNPQLVAEFARRAIEAFKKNSNLYCYSLSPSDGSPGWSQSKETQALEEKDPNGELSRTPLILNFYNEVARQVRQAMPDRIVAGYIYASYLYPPKMPVEPLEPNLFLVVAPSFDYGYRLYRPDVQKDFELVMGGWAKRTRQLGYYDLPTHFTSPGIPLGPGTEILRFIYPKLKGYGVKLVYVYGHPGWGGGGIGNYLEAKLAWNPDADVGALEQEYYERAYGKEAGAIIGGLYGKLDEAVKTYNIAHKEASHTLTPEILQAVYAGWYPQAEKGYLSAQKIHKTAAQEKRLGMFGKSLMLLQWHLRRMKMAPVDEQSPLYRTDEQMEKLLRDPANELALSPILQTPQQAAVEALTIKGTATAPANAAAPETFTLRGSSRVLLYSPTDTTVTVGCPVLKPYGVEFMRYLVRDETGKAVKEGMVREGTFLSYPLKAGHHAFLEITSRAGAYQLKVDGCDYAYGVPKGRNGVELLKSTPTLYFYVPQGAGAFGVTLTRDSLGVAVADVYGPDGKVAGTLDGNGRTIASLKIPARKAAPGVWRITFRKEASKTAYGIWVRLDRAVPSWLGVDPTRLGAIARTGGAVQGE